MRFTQYLSIFLLASLALAGSRANSQANVLENQTTYLYVDAQKGSDSNSGTSSLPLLTIGAAVSKANANNQKSIGTKIIVNPGVYRETVSVGSVSKQTTVPLTIQAATNGTAVIAGSMVLTGWAQQDASHPSISSAPWNYDPPACSIPSGWPTNFAPIALRTEMVFINGVPLTQVLNYSDMQAGTFYADGVGNEMYVWPPAGTNLSTATVEAAVRPSTITVQGRTNVVLRGLVFRHAANCMNTASAVVGSSTNVLLDSVAALWNNWNGISVSSSTSITVQNSIGSFNGGQGIGGTKDINSLFSGNESDANNWRGAMGTFYDWAMGGTKLFQMRTASVQNQHSYNNQAQGLWFDTDNQNVTINNATLAGNVMPALQIERNEGPLQMTNSTLCTSGVGVNVLTSENFTISHNVFYNNGGTGKYQAQIYLAGTSGGQAITDWQTGQNYLLFTTGMVLTGNTFVDASSGQNTFGTYLSGSDWTQFATTLTASNNTWYDPLTTTAFKIPNGKLVNLTGWQNAVSTDMTSVWAQPATSPAAACALPSPSFPDFNINMDSGSYTMSAGKVVATVHVNSFGWGPVGLTLSALPSGVTAAMSQTNLTSGVVTITFTASATAVNQKVPITLWAAGNSRVHSATFYVQVVPGS